MSDTYSTTPPVQPYPTDGGTDSTADVAKEQASHVAESAAGAGAKVAGTAKEEGAKVLGEAKTQVKDLYEQTRGELSEQAASQQARVATGLHSISEELGTMAGSASGGVASDLVQQAATRTESIASWLEQRDPGSLLHEVQNFARQRPGTFIAIAAGAGILAGRLTRSVKSVATDAAESKAASSGSASTYTAPAYTEPAYTAPAFAETAYTEEVVTADANTGLVADDITGSYPDGQYPVDDTVVGETRLGETRP
ncbi:MAG: hypothetical protein JWM50_2132 [Microbacteriaceae bacterium]|jgi:hypothetical protein|nr:hypothetical protein [Microbacteriaceae bacterium]